MHYKHKKLIWQIFPVNLVITLGAMLAVAWYGSSTLRDFYYDQMASALEARAYLIKDRINELLESGRIEELRTVVRRSGRDARTRISIIDGNGIVLADSDENPDVMENHMERPEIVSALQGNTGSSLRFSKTLQKQMLYVAVPLARQTRENAELATADGERVNVLRVAIPLTAINETLREAQTKIALGVFAVIFIAALITLIVSRRISKPLEEMKQSAERFSLGNFDRGMSLNKSESASLEVASLADAMDRMASQLNERIGTISRQRNELETVFASMAEAVIAVDNEERIISINQAAARIFGVDRQESQGKIIQEVVRNIDLHRQIKEILANPTSLQDEIILMEGQQQHYLQTNIVPLCGANGATIGALAVLNDVTRLRRLENVRRDFVANVSHELKTPITSIKGYVETLLDGAIDNREDAVAFLKIVHKQSDLLSAIIEDLLALSRIEKQSEDSEVLLKKEMLYPVLEESVLTCKMKAAEKNIHIALSCPENLQAKINATLFEQAVVNLVVNAIKYSEADAEVIVRAEEVQSGEDRRIVISVKDSGVGIAKQHLPRLFERFYRSDKARSRKLGGTGLGLAIVKHIVQAHGGEVAVESREGVGSTFFITLPSL